MAIEFAVSLQITLMAHVCLQTNKLFHTLHMMWYAVKTPCFMCVDVLAEKSCGV